MRGLISIAGFVAVAVAVVACGPSVPVALNATPPTPDPTPQYARSYYPPPQSDAPQYSPPPAPTTRSQTDVAEPASNARCFTGPGVPLCVPADQIWYKSATEWYNPSTYCKWGREQLPVRLQKVCNELDQKYPPKKMNWKRFEADNGQVFALDMNSISHLDGCGGCADAVMCIADNNQCLRPNMHLIRFDCHGHYIDTVSGTGNLLMAPARSVVGQMATIACAGAKDH
jgi:hypothetical protein